MTKTHADEDTHGAGAAKAAETEASKGPLTYEQARDQLMTLLGNHPQGKPILEAIRTEVLNLKPGI